MNGPDPALAPRIDPHRRQAQLQWRNRRAEWRAHWQETTFHLAAAALSLGVLGIGLLAALRAGGAAIVDAVDAHRWPLAAATFVVVLLSSHRRLQARRRRWQVDWLAALPVAEAERRQALARSQRGRAAGMLAMLAAVALALSVAGHPPPLFALVLLASVALLAQSIAGMLDRPRRLQLADLPMRGGGDPHATAVRGRGRLWRWQLAALSAAARGRALAPGLLLLLLLPMGRYSLLLAPMIIAGALAMAALWSAWRFALAVIVEAEAWLTAQPWPPRARLQAGLPLPLALLAGVCTALAMLGLALGAPAAAALAAVLLAAMALLQLAVVCALRRQPRRIGPALVLHMSLAVTLLATLPPLAAVVFVLQLAWLARRALAA